MARQARAKVTRLTVGGEPRDAAVAAFLTERDLAPSSHRVYLFTLARLTDHLGPDTPQLLDAFDGRGQGMARRAPERNYSADSDLVTA